MTRDDAISRQGAIDALKNLSGIDGKNVFEKYSLYPWNVIKELPSVSVAEKTGRCKDCKYFEYDSVAKVDGIPLIVAHEICSRWGDGCKTREDGYCFLYEPQESEDKE